MDLLKYILVFSSLIVFSQGYFKLTNVQCFEYDKTFATFSICQLKLIRRGVVALDLHTKLYQLPVTNVSIHLQLFKKASGFRPFLYNVSVDFCQLMKNVKKFPVIKVFTGIVAKDSNINHTCPYNHDIIVKHLVLDNEMFKLFPLPQGEYLLHVRVGAYNDWKALVKVYMIVEEKTQ